VPKVVGPEVLKSRAAEGGPPQVHDLVFAAARPEEEEDDVEEDAAPALPAGREEALELRVLFVNRPRESADPALGLGKALDLAHGMFGEQSHLGPKALSRWASPVRKTPRTARANSFSATSGMRSASAR
jgi:hypothetical protein